MARGVTPRQPAKTGRQEGAPRGAGIKAARMLAKTGRAKAPVSTRPVSTRPIATRSIATPMGKKRTQRYNPLAPERIEQILQRLDQLYPDVACALHHKSAWELVVATILSAQS